jgi:hypothetical protein
MASKFAEFLETQKIDPRRLAPASRKLETLRPEDRKLRLNKRLAKKSESKPAATDTPPPKPRSGRAITAQLLEKAVAGKPVPGPAKTRLLRAVNRILEQKKKDPVDLRALF